MGVITFEFRKDFWRENTRVPGLSCGVVCMFLCLAILVEQTDRQTHDHGIYRASIASRGKNDVGPTANEVSASIQVFDDLRYVVCLLWYGPERRELMALRWYMVRLGFACKHARLQY